MTLLIHCIMRLKEKALDNITKDLPKDTKMNGIGNTYVFFV